MMSLRLSKMRKSNSLGLDKNISRHFFHGLRKSNRQSSKKKNLGQI